MSINFYKEIIDNYKNLYETKEGYDTKIYAGEKQNIKEFHVHSFILKTQSKFFKSAFTEEIQKKDGYFILNLNYSPKIFEILLSYMYSGSIDITKLQPFDIINLLLPLDELGLQPLITYIQKILIENYFDLTANNVIETLELTYQKKSFDKLWDFNIQRICYNPDLLFKSTKFLTVNPSILEIFLKRDDFCIDDEIIIWENLFKWACGQNPVTHQDINKWNKNDFTVMGRRLNRFIPSIRFYNISSEDFLLKVYPFKELLPNDLINNIFAYHMVPNNRQNIITQPYRKSHSIIINSQHFAIFASWIEKKNSSYYNEKNIPYKFNLLYRASRDGNTDAEFHKKCDNKGPTIVIARFTDSEQIVGGYNPLDWKPVYSYNGYYKSTKDSFIFLFTNKSNLQTAKASYPIDENQIYSIWCNPCCGPTFGSGNDLLCSNGNWSSNQFTYHKIHFPSNFNINDYEVFQIKK